MINPLGTRVETVWNALKNSESGVGYISVFDASNYPTKIAAEVRNWDVSDCGQSVEAWALRGRHARFAAGAASQAIIGSGLLDSISDRTRVGVYFGAGEGNQDFYNFTNMVAVGSKSTTEFDMDAFVARGLEILNPALELEQEPSMPAAHVANLFDLQGPNLNCLTACAASSQAVGEATELIRRGEVDAMVAGGAHSMIHPFGLTGFSLLTALSTNNDNPKGA
jgi:3-oxoacyl-[acyl-carrier-protein] synthase II